MISIVIPVYNAEVYIQECVHSIQSSLKTKFEILVIDDGSTDSTRYLCQQLAMEDSRVRYHYQYNAGVSAARNLGIDLANGKWIIFVDADDKFSFSGDYTIFNSAADIIVFSKVFENKEISLHEKSDLIEYIKGILKCSDFTHYNKGYLNAVWSKVYNLDLIKECGIKFSTNLINGEDSIFNLDVVENANAIQFHNQSIYQWRKTSGSATSKYQRNMIQTDKFFLKELHNKLVDLDILNDIRQEYNRIALNGLWIVLFQCLGHYLNRDKVKTKFEIYTGLKNSFPYDEAFKSILNRKIQIDKKRGLVFGLLNRFSYPVAFTLLRAATKRKHNSQEEFLTI
ncbi:glycosyltransferase family 2 protein [Macellibacteroides fermentans]|uniref:glycosyltransferase family 2 protein n=1 Tax=Macellibacteroides fermentans TaxID=879969 RepID=UPI00406C23ED